MAEQPPKLLFDENLAARLVRELADVYPGSVHVGDVGLLGTSDLAIWQYAQGSNYIVVTKDQDYHRLSVLYGPLPKVIWIGLGNCATDEIVRLLRARRDDIEAFRQDEESGFLALG